MFDLLALFDAFEHDAEPFSFRDLILSRKYAGLLAERRDLGGDCALGASVGAGGVADGDVAASGRTEADPCARRRRSGAELDGQRLLPLQPIEDESEEYFSLAEAAEAAGLYAEAAVLYGHCLSIDPNDSVAAYNRANCLKAAHDNSRGGARLYAAIKRDPDFVEAWFNYAGLLREEGKIASARQHLRDGDRDRRGLCRRDLQPRDARV